MAELLATPIPDSQLPAIDVSAEANRGVTTISRIEAQVVMATKRASEFARRIETDGIRGEALELLRDDVAHIATTGEALPAAEAIGGLVELQEAIFSAIERGGHRVRDARELFVGAAMTTAMLSRVMQDLGRSHQALSLCRTVYVCADAAEHTPLQAWARNEMSLISYRTGSIRRALDFADSAVSITRSSRGSTRAWAWSLKARAAAAVQGEAETREAIARARQARESMVPDDLDDIGGLFDFSEVRQIYYTAGALVSLENASVEAESEALQAVSFFEGTPGSYATEAGARSELALARVMLGEIAGAAEALRPVLELPPERRIAGILDSVARVQRALTAPHLRLSGEAVDLRNEIESFRQISAARAIEAK
ncbi:hypothetical protein ABZS29_29305 [Kribbella sp. NPDC005582]|uniref:hypothetical protein n=1 Tax=Kribbella sp. NPDC005582 TaxID=3156893 RepID=UPI0033B05B73